MGPLVAGALVGGAELIGGLLGSSANARQAEENRRFQERMSNTQYQRAVRDMRRAGLNPMLAYMQGGAGNLPGSTMDVSQLGESVGSAIPKALEAASAKQALEMQRVAMRMQRTSEEKLGYERETAKAESVLRAKDAAMRDYDLIRQRWYFGGADYEQAPSADSAFAAELRRAKIEADAAGYGAESTRLSLAEMRAMQEMWTRLGSSGKFAELVMPWLLRLFGSARPVGGGQTFNFRR